MDNIITKFEDFEKTYSQLCSHITLNQITPFMEIATTASAIITANDTCYIGVNIKADCGLGFCSERNAMSTMLTNGETRIKYIMCVDRTHSLRLPCGACREFIAQINPQNLETEIIQSLSPFKSVKVKDLLPEWWGHDKLKRK